MNEEARALRARLHQHASTKETEGGPEYVSCKCQQCASVREALVDAAAFESAVRNVDLARYYRERKAEILAARSWTRSELTAGQCEAKARRAEARVREIALQSEILLAQRARTPREVACAN